MRSPVRAVLFDADGVVQSSSLGWREDLAAMAATDPDGFVAALHAAEVGPIRGDGSFHDTATAVLERFGVTRPVDDVLAVWQRLDADAGVLDGIAALRADGVVCALATNQHDVRTRFMREAMGYDTVFDAQFYSSEVGHAKPSAAFFTYIVTTLGLDAAQVLFLDDRADNVEGARSAGLQAEVFAEHGGRAELDRVLALHDWAPGRRG
ncbi:MAG: HAD-IA family hydrolase [Lapillicoccus sp.]